MVLQKFQEKIAKKCLKTYTILGVFLTLLGITVFLHHKAHLPNQHNHLLGYFVPIDRIVVRKSQRTLEIYHGKKCLKTYVIALGFSSTGAKCCQGDGKTPEGTYMVIYKNPKSAFHLSLRLDYPQEKDTFCAQQNGCSPGTDIMIHGLGRGRNSHPDPNWTAGCIAVTNTEIEEIYAGASLNTKVLILP